MFFIQEVKSLITGGGSGWCDVMALIWSGREGKTNSLRKKKRVCFFVKIMQRAQMQTFPPYKDRQWKLQAFP